MSKNFKLEQTVREYFPKDKVVLTRDNKGFERYVEIPYKEYRADGTIVTGTEDFTTERVIDYLGYYWVFSKTGYKYKEGLKHWEELGRMYCTSTKDAEAIAHLKYGDKILVVR